MAKQKYLGTIGGGIGPLIPGMEQEEQNQVGAHALIDQPTEIDGIGGLNPTEGTDMQVGAHSLVDTPHEIDNLPELKKRMTRQEAIA